MNFRIGQPVRIEFEITDPIEKQGQFGKIKKVNVKEETAIIEFDDKKQGTYCFGTFEIPDAFNEGFLFSNETTYFLTLIAKGEINVQDLATKELQNRGLNIDGNWIGFKK